MAFNLNKNDGSAPRDPSGKPAFDLSKSDSPAVEETPRKPKYWVWVLLALALAGAAAWYFTAAGGSRSLPSDDPALLSAANPVQNAAAADTTKLVVTATDSSRKAVIPGPVASTGVNPAGVSSAKDSVVKSKAAGPVSARSLLHPVAASFHRGSSSFARISQAMVTQIITTSKINGKGLVNVNGYASSEGDPIVNQKISQTRADVFKQYLVSKGMPENHIVATGKGTDNPIAGNDTEEGRRKNRRVEVIIQQ